MIFFFVLNTVLDPRLKLNYYKKYEWEEEFINQAKNIFIDVYKKDYSSTTTINDNEEVINEDDFFYELFGNNNNNNNDNDFEIEDYLNKPVVGFKVDILQWWRVNCNLIFLI